MLRGFDVSHHQGAENWADMKARFGLTWGACKATEGEGFRDDRFVENWRRMKVAGLVRMAYHFARPDSNPRDDAANFLSYVESAGAIEPTDVIVMDMESNPGNLPMLEVRDWLAGWADEITRATGRKPFLYCGSGYIANNATKDLQPHYAEWWFPRYPTRYANQSVWPIEFNPTIPTPRNWIGLPAIWQYSSTFPVGGEEHDANVCRLTLNQLRTTGIQEEDMAEATLSAATITAIAKAVVGVEVGTTNKSLGAFAQDHSKALGVLLGRDPVDVDEAELAALLAPLLTPQLQVTVADLSDAALSEIAGVFTAAAPALAGVFNDELARRQVS